jgi:hypothetical protein
MEEAHQVPLVE